MQIIIKYLTPPEFEHGAGCPVYPNWKNNILVDLGPDYKSCTLGRWLQRQGIRVEANGILVGPEPVSSKGKMRSLQSGKPPYGR